MTLLYSEFQKSEKRQSTLGKPTITDFVPKQHHDLNNEKILKKLTENNNEFSDDDEEAFELPQQSLLASYPALPHPQNQRIPPSERPKFGESERPKVDPERKETEGYQRDPSFSMYQQAYVAPPTIAPKPYYAASSSSDVSQLTEKLNYLIHLMEEQQNAKTNHIGEEFMMYTFLGIGMIFLVDSFSKTARYIR
jgi:hypothetical protein